MLAPQPISRPGSIPGRSRGHVVVLTPRRWAQAMELPHRAEPLVRDVCEMLSTGDVHGDEALLAISLAWSHASNGRAFPSAAQQQAAKAQLANVAVSFLRPGSVSSSSLLVYAAKSQSCHSPGTPAA